MAVDERAWQEHIDQDKQQSKDICSLKLAMFGDPRSPESVKAAVVPTMTRINAWLDALRWAVAGIVTLAITAPAWTYAAKLLLRELQ